jgi:hypothetical protein
MVCNQIMNDISFFALLHKKFLNLLNIKLHIGKTILNIFWEWIKKTRKYFSKRF